MTQAHRQSFFGHKTGMVVMSHDWTEPWIMVTFIKKKGEGASVNWEKFNEGKTLKFSLIELAAILSVLRGEKPLFKTFHKFKEGGTPVEVRYERGRGASDPETVVFSAGGYVRPISWPETDVLRMLMEHLFEEKVQNATNIQVKTKSTSTIENESNVTLKSDEEAINEEFGAMENVEMDDTAPKEENPQKKSPLESPLVLQFKDFHFHPPPARVPPSAIIVKGDLYGIERDVSNPLLIIDQGNGQLLEIPSERVLYATQEGEEVTLVVGDEPLVAPGRLRESPKELRSSPNVASFLPSKTKNGEDSFPDGILARAKAVKKITEKAVCVENQVGSLLWIPKSAFAEDQSIPDGPLENSWDFSLKGWFARKSDAQAWLAGH